MSNAIVIGAQWGDEGKGKAVDIMAPGADYVVRYQGGPNAGHTLVNEGKKIVLHLLPSGIITAGCVNVIGNGCVIDPVKLWAEIENLDMPGADISPESLIISPAAHVITTAHIYADRHEGAAIGTTGRGIGPCYRAKTDRCGIRMESLADGTFKDKYESAVKLFCESNNLGKKDVKKLLDETKDALKYAQRLRKFIKDPSDMIFEASKKKKNILFEGAQGTFLDIDHGTYPFVTSSSTTIGGALTGSGVFLEFSKRIAIVKAYTTRVGNGPFPTELENETGERLRACGSEYGSTTGRPRRCGWLDIPLLKKAFVINGFNYIVLTKLDCLSGFEKIKVAVGRDKKGMPVYETLDGWMSDIAGMKKVSDLPLKCRKYIKYIEDQLGTSVGIISTGPDRKDTIVVEKTW
ncbi:MAG TPA: adenylosuccinate synthase [Candidatus Wallbacteria bacterium]|nr:adenylosuccinate synthase [Candidatus Wallbacteria bacterium]